MDKISLALDSAIKAIPESNRSNAILEAGHAIMAQIHGGPFEKCPCCGGNKLEVEFYHGSRRCRLCNYREVECQNNH